MTQISDPSGSCSIAPLSSSTASFAHPSHPPICICSMSNPDDKLNGAMTCLRPQAAMMAITGLHRIQVCSRVLFTGFQFSINAFLWRTISQGVFSSFRLNFSLLSSKKLHELNYQLMNNSSMLFPHPLYNSI